MTEAHPGENSTDRAAEQTDGLIRYPTHHVIAILNTQEQATDATKALTSSGFLDSEVTVASGAAAADDLDTSTGRTGLSRLAMRLAESLGIRNSEMEFKEKYEQTLRDGGFLVLVNAPTEERKNLATRILRDHGAQSVNYYGRFSIELNIQPRAD